MAININDYFDRVVVMTLDKRMKSGDSTIVEELSKYGCVPERFYMGDGHLFPKDMYGHIDVDAHPRRQGFNYASSLIKVVRQAFNDNLNNLFYLEDDATLTEKFEDVFPAAMAELSDKTWDLLFIGGNHTNGNYEKVSDHLAKTTCSLDLHAVVFNKTAFPKLLSIKIGAEETIDGIIAGKQKRGEFQVLAFYPGVIIQKPGWSYNENRHDDKRDRYWI